MFKFIIDIFCKDTVIGLSTFNDISEVEIPGRYENLKLYKNFYYNLFNDDISEHRKFKDSFTDPIAYHLSEVFRSQKALYSV